MTKVMLTAPGIKAVGDYQAGEVYDVDDKLANILINIKGFERVTDTVASPVKPKEA